LRSLIAQTKPFGIPICVSDNASLDGTVEVLRFYKKEYPQLHFRSNDSNLGFDLNLLNAVQMASTKYVWLFGDRLRLLPKAVRRVCNILAENDLNLLLLNTDAQARLFKQEKSIRNMRYLSPQDVFRDLCLNAGAVGDQIVPVKAFSNSALKGYVGNGWIHFAATFEHLANLKNIDVMFTARPSITYSRSRSSWIPNWFKIWDSWKKTVEALPDTYSNESKEYVNKYAAKLQFLAPANLVNLRIEGIYNHEIYRRYQGDLQKYAEISPSAARAIARLPIGGVRFCPLAKRVLSKSLRTIISLRTKLRVKMRPNERLQKEKELMAQIMNTQDHKNATATGSDCVEMSLREGVATTVLLSEDLEPYQIETFAELAERKSVKLEIVSTKTAGGRKLRDSFEGIAAVLRPRRI
jgi:glycosyltransferase involved in cell wall biosynthesis